MANITRTFREYHATSYKVASEGGEFKLEPEYECDYLAQTADERTARRELRNAGYPVRSGTIVKVEPGKLHKYTCTIDAFLSVATDTIVEE